MQRIQLRSPLARAVAPVAAGLAFFAVLGLILWGVSAWISGNPESSRLGDPTFAVGRVDRVADSIAEQGPLLYPDLKDPDGGRSVVIDHRGDSDLSGWAVYRPVPADRDEDCLAEQTEGTASFVDCEGRVLDVTQLTPAEDVSIVIQDGETLVLVFEGALPATTVATPSSTTAG